MTGAEVRRARATLGTMWGISRPLRASELGRLLALAGRDPGRSVLDWESGKAIVSGPASIAIWYMLHSGHKPPTFKELFIEIASPPPKSTLVSPK